MKVTLFGIFTLVKPVHPLNTELPIDITLFGIFTLNKFEQPLNALAVMILSPVPIVKLVKAVQF